MGTVELSPAERPAALSPAGVEVVLPVYNEEADLRANVERLRAYLVASFPFPAVVTIADNASTDATWQVASALSRELPGVRAVRLSEKGRGRALRAVWSVSEAPVVAYMDIDLATDLDALLPLIAPLLSGHSDVAIGTRLARGSRVVRGPKRELLSRGYNLLVHVLLRNGFSDAQCGFKALRADVARSLLPLVQDDDWFFDTELLVRAERGGLRIHEVPVDWVDDPGSRVELRQTVTEDLRGIWRLMWDRTAGPPSAARRPPPQLVRFAGVGVLSTLVYLVLFLVLRGPLGAQAANAASLVVCTVANTAAHRRVTFAERGSPSWRTWIAGTAAVLATSLAFTSAALAVADALDPTSVALEVAVLLVATALAALVRFVLLRAWIFSNYRRRVDRRPVPPLTR